MANNPTRRKTGRQYRPVLWIACEGIAEKEYFSRRGVMPEEYSVKAYYKQGRSDPRQTVGLLLEKSARKRPGDLLWAVFDREDRQARPDAVIQQAADTAKANGARVAVSNPCFELWLLLHFEQASPNTAEAAVKRLQRHWPGYDKHVAGRPLTPRQVAEACRRARQMDASAGDQPWPKDRPGSTVYRMF